MDNLSNTIKFNSTKTNEFVIKETFNKVYKSLELRGYDPINQLVGYLITGEPTYITSKDDSRQLMTKIDRNEIIECLLVSFLNSKNV